MWFLQICANAFSKIAQASQVPWMAWGWCPRKQNAKSGQGFSAMPSGYLVTWPPLQIPFPYRTCGNCPCALAALGLPRCAVNHDWAPEPGIRVAIMCLPLVQGEPPTCSLHPPAMSHLFCFCHLLCSVSLGSPCCFSQSLLSACKHIKFYHL